MTHRVTSELAPATPSPYRAEVIHGVDLGLPVDDDLKIQVERWDETVTDLDRAHEIYDAFGGVILSPNTILSIGDHDVRVEDFAQANSDYVIERLEEHPEAIREKDYIAYNGTPRLLHTVAPENVEGYLPEVLTMQKALLPVVRRINGDPTTEVSVDDAEGTVVNLQLFDKNNDKQEHGAHTDRVDTTVIICLDNIGPHGDLVFVNGYTAVCEKLGLSPHRGFYHNLDEIMEREPEALTFRVHPVRPGSMLVLKSAEDVHLISAKTIDDVTTGAEQTGIKPQVINGMMLGRGVINAAFETDECRETDRKAKALEAKFPIHDKKENEAFFAELDRALETIPPADRKDVGNAIVTRRSADDLYKDEKANHS